MYHTSWPESGRTPRWATSWARGLADQHGDLTLHPAHDQGGHPFRARLMRGRLRLMRWCGLEGLVVSAPPAARHPGQQATAGRGEPCAVRFLPSSTRSAKLPLVTRAERSPRHRLGALVLLERRAAARGGGHGVDVVVGTRRARQVRLQALEVGLEGPRVARSARPPATGACGPRGSWCPAASCWNRATGARATEGQVELRQAPATARYSGGLDVTRQPGNPAPQARPRSAGYLGAQP